MFDTTQIVTVWMCFYTLVYTASDTVQALVWDETLADRTKLEACAGDTVSFRWGVHLADGESVDMFNFHRKLGNGTTEEGYHEDEVNTEIHTTDARFTFGPGYQLHITKAVVQDSGKYTLKINVTQRGGGEAHVYRNRVSLMVKASPVTINEGPKAQLLPQAVMVTDGPQPGWHVKLSCGTFRHLGHPPVTVQWMTPSGRLLPSTAVKSGEFYLAVPNPVETGLYSCNIDRGSPALGCVDPNSVLRRQSAVPLDTYEARMQIVQTSMQVLLAELEKKQKELEAKLLANINQTAILKQKDPCPFGFHVGAGKCYLLTGFGGMQDWETSRKACLAIGAKLAEPMNQEENKFVKNMIRAYVPRDNVWLGGKRANDEKGTFLWDSTQQVITFTDWGKGEPNSRVDNSSEICLWLWKDIGHQWDDTGCFVRSLSVCEKMPDV